MITLTQSSLWTQSVSSFKFSQRPREVQDAGDPDLRPVPGALLELLTAGYHCKQASKQADRRQPQLQLSNQDRWYVVPSFRKSRISIRKIVCCKQHLRVHNLNPSVREVELDGWLAGQPQSTGLSVIVAPPSPPRPQLAGSERAS